MKLSGEEYMNLLIPKKRILYVMQLIRNTFSMQLQDLTLGFTNLNMIAINLTTFSKPPSISCLYFLSMVVAKVA